MTNVPNRGCARERHVPRSRHPGGAAAPRRGGTLAIRLARCFLLGAGVVMGMLETAGRAETVALWLFDEQVGVYPDALLNDAGPKSYFLILGRGAEIVPGKFGNALRPVAPGPPRITPDSSLAGDGAMESGSRAKPARTQPPLRGENAHFAALFTHGAGHRQGTPFANATDSRLNLGPHDWTIEGWLQIDRNARAEGTLFEIGSGPRGENQLLTRFSVLPRENAFALTSLSSAPDDATGVSTTRIEYADAEGPPVGVAYLRSTTLALHDASVPRERWFHLALVHIAASRHVHLFIDGRPRAVASITMMALPHGAEAYVSVGRDGRCETPLPGALDEMRVSDHAVYTTEFAPPRTFARQDTSERRSPPALSGPAQLLAALRAHRSFVDGASRGHDFLDNPLFAPRHPGNRLQLLNR